MQEYEKGGAQPVYPESLIIGGGAGLKLTKEAVKKAIQKIKDILKNKDDIKEIKTRITRSGEKAVNIERKDGSIIDISPKRVKEYTPNTNPKAPPGTLNKKKYENYIPSSKGYKRPPTEEELEILKNAK